jgi:4-hydroxy-3-polyprenylbenzoate decarboxylase
LFISPDFLIVLKYLRGYKMANKDITSMRSTIEFLKSQADVLTVENEVDPICEISGIQKSFDNGPALLFENIKSYPDVRSVGNIFATNERIAKIFDVNDGRNMKFKCLDAMRNPIKPVIVGEAPCQEVVITEDIDVMATLPIIKHTEKDGARILGCGNPLLSGKYFRGGYDISFKRMHFRGKDWATILAAPGTHLGGALLEHMGEKVPLTINLCTPPAVLVAAAGGGIHTVIPPGESELDIAGGIQGSPIEIVKAKTVDAYAIANAEWVIEGYVSTTEREWETDESERLGKAGVAPLFPEWPGFMGRANRTWKFYATALTHRKDRPIFYTPLTHTFEHDILMAPLLEACFFELADRLIPGLIADVHILPCTAVSANVIYQIKKRRRADDGFQRNILRTALSASIGLRLAVIVDEDVDIYSADEIIWAMTTRVDPETGIIIGGGGKRAGLLPIERFRYDGKMNEAPLLLYGGIGIDATVPFEAKWALERAHYPVDKVDLRKWFSEEDIAKVKTMQHDYAKYLAKTGR